MMTPARMFEPPVDVPARQWPQFVAAIGLALAQAGFFWAACAAVILCARTS